MSQVFCHRARTNLCFTVIKTHFLLDSKFPAGLIYRGNLINAFLVLFKSFKVCLGWGANLWSFCLSYLNYRWDTAAPLPCSVFCLWCLTKSTGEIKKTILQLYFTIVSKKWSFTTFYITFLRLNFWEYLLIKSQKITKSVSFCLKNLNTFKKFCGYTTRTLFSSMIEVTNAIMYAAIVSYNHKLFITLTCVLRTKRWMKLSNP